MNINISIFNKLKIILNYYFSSFMSLELLIMVICVFAFLFLNLKSNKRIIKIFVPISTLLFLAFIAMGFHNYVVAAIEQLIKMVMNYFYFPSMAFYFVIIILSTIYLIYNVWTPKYSDKYKIFNYSFALLLYILFIGLFSYVVSNGISLSIDYSIYKDQYIISFVQISNIVFALWFVAIAIIKLYKYFKKKYD